MTLAKKNMVCKFITIKNSGSIFITHYGKKEGLIRKKNKKKSISVHFQTRCYLQFMKTNRCFLSRKTANFLRNQRISLSLRTGIVHLIKKYRRPWNFNQRGWPSHVYIQEKKKKVKKLCLRARLKAWGMSSTLKRMPYFKKVKSLREESDAYSKAQAGVGIPSSKKKDNKIKGCPLVVDISRSDVSYSF